MSLFEFLNLSGVVNSVTKSLNCPQWFVFVFCLHLVFVFVFVTLINRSITCIVWQLYSAEIKTSQSYWVTRSSIELCWTAKDNVRLFVWSFFIFCRVYLPLCLCRRRDKDPSCHWARLINSHYHQHHQIWDGRALEEIKIVCLAEISSLQGTLISFCLVVANLRCPFYCQERSGPGRKLQRKKRN